MQRMTISRRDFIVSTSSIVAGTVAFGPKILFGTDPVTDVSIVRGGETAAATRKAIELLGGMSRYVAQDDVVVVKPNIGWNREPDHDVARGLCRYRPGSPRCT